MPRKNKKLDIATIAHRIEALKGDLITIARKIHAQPELGFAEHHACKLQVEILRREGFDVVVPYSGLDTAFRATWGRGKPVVCFMSEYDALPGVGHGCGHNLIASAALGAGFGLQAALKESGIEGTVIVLGTPGEEGGGGKVILARNGVFDDVDVALMAHPSIITTPDCGRSAIVRRTVTFHGQAAHAASATHLGRNALDAVMLLFAGINAWRQHLPETARVHGIITNGGEAANIIPSKASCLFYLRAADDDTITKMDKRFEAIANGAAMMTETTVQIVEHSLPYKAGRVNKPLNDEYFSVAQSLGLEPQPGNRSRASSDFGDVAAIRPAAHVYFGITREAMPGHSPQFAEASATEMAMERMLLVAQALAAVGRRFCNDTEFKESVIKDFNSLT